MKKVTKTILSMVVAFTLLGGAAACGGTDNSNEELLNKISTLETQMTEIQQDLGDKINDLQDALDG